ncbi:MAG: hypothetical protein KGJ74_05275 [Betaproteobacteria bacterium]|jgi:hypothetical protein|uniref:3-dehydroquinate synthase family protein n=1 Tax=Thiomonas sp. TaxID=2047785 RepID=UPI000BCCB5B5|nr:hypothetical protein [Thiomonas sp.]MDE2129059.1 hypothetical protein [Betaproteobacteria bacterium]OZB62966.1 MAG: hypothetical protein B7X31_07135 [Thiomonas sp. 13-66-29]
MSVIYEKTETGRQALQTRDPDLTRPLRNLLLMIDGNKSDADLHALLSASGVDLGSFDALQQHGWIRARTVVHESAPGAEGPATTVDPAARQRRADPKPEPRQSAFSRLGQSLRTAIGPREQSAREISAGLAEVIKCAAVADAELFAWLEHHVQDLLAQQPQAVTHAVQRIQQLRSDIEAEDRVQRRSPSPLEFGMPLASVIESILGYGRYLHGEALGLGMAVAVEISHELGMQTTASAQRFMTLLRNTGLPMDLPQAPVDRWLELLPVQNDGSSGHMSLVLLQDVGQPVSKSVPRTLIMDILDRAGTLVF